MTDFDTIANALSKLEPHPYTPTWLIDIDRMAFNTGDMKQPEVEQYIKQLLQSDTGVVTETRNIRSPRIFRNWLYKHARYTGLVNEETMRQFALNFPCLPKIRSFWVNSADFKHLSGNVHKPDEAFFASKLLDEQVVMPDDDFVKRGEFWFCTNDEYMILKYGK